MTSRPDIALLGHLASIGEYQQLLGAARGTDLPPLDAESLGSVLRYSDPMPICDLEFQSPRGTRLRGRYIDIAFLTEWMRRLDTGAKVRAGCFEAARCGARLGALGGFSSILGERLGLDLAAEFGIPFTTGNTLTAAVIAAQVEALAGGSRAPLVAIIGAGGDVGSGVARVLDARGYTVLLVGRTPAPVQRLHHELEHAAVETLERALRSADIVVLAASTGPGQVQLHAARPTAWVLDAGHPYNGSGRTNGYAVSGRVLHAAPPRSDLPELLSLRYPAGESHACLAEAEVLGFEGRWEAYSGRRGGITADRAAKMLRLAERHGIVPAPLHGDPPGSGVRSEQTGAGEGTRGSA